MLKCLVNMDKKRIHITDTEDESIDIFQTFEDDDYDSAIVKAGYANESLQITIVGGRVEKSKFKINEVHHIIPATVCRTVYQKGAHQYLDKYILYFKSIHPKIVAIVNPDIEKDYAICKENYPDGIDINIEAPSEMIDKVKHTYETMMSDLDMVTEELAEFRLHLTSC